MLMMIVILILILLFERPPRVYATGTPRDMVAPDKKIAAPCSAPGPISLESSAGRLSRPAGRWNHAEVFSLAGVLPGFFCQPQSHIFCILELMTLLGAHCSTRRRSRNGGHGVGQSHDLSGSLHCLLLCLLRSGVAGARRARGLDAVRFWRQLQALPPTN